MKYVLEVYLPKCKFWALACTTSNLRFLDHKKQRLIKQGHKVRETINYKLEESA